MGNQGESLNPLGLLTVLQIPKEREDNGKEISLRVWNHAALG